VLSSKDALKQHVLRKHQWDFSTPLVTPLCMWGPMGDVNTRAQYQLNRFRG